MTAIITNHSKPITARRVIIILCLAALILATLACIGGGDPTPGGWTPTQGGPGDGVHATMTYGAEEFHAQLTAIATGTP